MRKTGITVIVVAIALFFASSAFAGATSDGNQYAPPPSAKKPPAQVQKQAPAQKVTTTPLPKTGAEIALLVGSGVVGLGAASLMFKRNK